MQRFIVAITVPDHVDTWDVALAVDYSLEKVYGDVDCTVWQSLDDVLEDVKERGKEVGLS